jgi:hypothetical protein
LTHPVVNKAYYIESLQFIHKHDVQQAIIDPRMFREPQTRSVTRRIKDRSNQKLFFKRVKIALGEFGADGYGRESPQRAQRRKDVTRLARPRGVRFAGVVRSFGVQSQTAASAIETLPAVRHARACEINAPNAAAKHSA